MENDGAIKKGFFYGISRIFSFLITAAIGGILGISITKQTLFAALFAIFGGFIGTAIFKGWWNSMASSSIAPTLKALIFTIFTIVLMAGIIFLVLGRV